ncbi:HyaD/HybD family hydrogenase maturation endopeptidase [Oceanobacter kriegii]|uniref:HyaD/HybD family hydrogenase maturation endopeptidase n=1 Tax=Oceanobacter kriegii TaxID=64972 RepID=UPI000417EE61|nr:HyaD/HybD family hydrogenase maturation endopeptidase [Oceanobacter kriegii]
MKQHILILGIGNVLWADEGFGVRCVEHINQHFELPDNVEILDGGTQGLYLVQHVQNCDILVVFDAVDYGLEPGTLKIVEGDEVPKFMGAKKMSLHQTGFQEVLALAEFAGGYPDELLLLGVQPEALEDFGGSLRDVVKDQIAPAVQIAVDYLAERDTLLVPRPQAEASVAEDLSPNQLAIHVYESGRPDEDDACRIGDSRFMPKTEASH